MGKSPFVSIASSGDKQLIIDPEWDSASAADEKHRLTVTVELGGRVVGEDTVSVLVNQAGEYRPPHYFKRDMDNAIGAYPAKRILGTQLGPNKNGKQW